MKFSDFPELSFEEVDKEEDSIQREVYIGPPQLRAKMNMYKRTTRGWGKELSKNSRE